MADAAAARQLASQTAASATQAATAQAARLAAEEAAETAAQRAARLAAEEAAETAAQRAARLAAEQAAETAAQRSARLAAEAAAETAAENAARKASKLSAQDAAMYAAAAAAAGLGLYTFIEADSAANESNNTPREITKVEYSSSNSQSVLKITFTPALRILLGDDLTFRDTQTTPVINGPATVKDVFSNSQIEVDFGSTQVVSLQPGGYIDVRTTTAAQAAALAGDAGDTIGDAGGNFLDGLLPDWMNDMGDVVKKVLLIISCLIFSGVIAFVVSKLL